MVDPASLMVIAHRGACGHRPEHTAAAYRLALDLGADAVEPDVVPSRDGVLVVRHESELSTTTDVTTRAEFRARRTVKEVEGTPVDGWFTEDFTWQELRTLRARERIPGLRPANRRFDDRWPLLRLAEVVQLVHERARPAHVVVELKHPAHFRHAGLPLEDLLEQELRVAGVAADPRWLTVESFEKSVLSAVAERGVRSRRVYAAEHAGAAYDEVVRAGSAAVPYAQEVSPAGLRRLGALRVTRPGGSAERLLHGVSVARATLVEGPAPGRRLVEQAHALRLGVWCFTLRPENVFLRPRHRCGPDAAHGRWRTAFAEVLATGVDGVFVDHPDLLAGPRLRVAQPAG